MASTLVIKNASFALNRLDVVEFANVPCTGITLTKDAFTFTSYGQEETIGYTLTPNDTTDVVNIASSNENIVAILNGKAVAVGVGNATITITCGNQIATISVTSSMTMERYFKSGYLAQKSTSSIKTYAVDSSANNWGYCGAENEWGDKRTIAASSSPYIPVYRIPGNCASVEIEVPSGWKTILLWFDSKQEGYSGLNVAYLVSGEAVGDAVTGDRTVSVPEGADSIGIAYRTTLNNFSESDLTGYDVTFIPAVNET